MISGNDIHSLISRITVEDIDSRRHLISDYAYELYNDVGEDFFAELLKDEKDDVCKWYEIIALGNLKSIKYIPLLINILLKDNVMFATGTSLHTATAFSLGQIGEPALPFIYPLISDSRTDTRIAALDSIGEIHSSSSLPVIKSVLNEPYSKVIIYAGMALTRIGKPSIELIDDISKATEPSILIILIDSLAGIDTEKVYPVMYDIYLRNPEVTEKALSLNTKNITLFKERLHALTSNENIIEVLKAIALPSK